MSSLKKILKNLKLLELEKHKYRIVREEIEKLTYITLAKLDNKYKNDIQVMEDKFDKMILEMDKVKKVKIVVPKYKPKKKIIFRRLFVILTLMIIIGIIYNIEIIILVSIIMIIMLVIAWLFNMEYREDYIYDNVEYENALKNYLYQYNRLLELRNSLGNNRFTDLYLKYKNMIEEYYLFTNKYSLLKKIEKELIIEIDKNIVMIDKELRTIYDENNIDKEYNNYLAISMFYEYIKDKKVSDLTQLYKLYKQEYSFILNDTDGIIDKVNNNKLKEDIDKKEINKFNKILEELELCIIDRNFDVTIINTILMKLKKEIIGNKKLINNEENILKDKKNVKREDSVVVSVKNAKKINIKESKKEAEKVMKKVNKTLELIKLNDSVGSYDDKKIEIVKKMLDNNKDSIIEGLKYYGINTYGKMVVSSDVRTYIINLLYVPNDYFSNIKFPHALVNRMVMDIENKLGSYTKVKLDIDKINRILENDEKVYKFRRNDIVFEIDIKILKDTIDLLGEKIDCYVFKENEPIYICNKNGEKAILMANLNKK